MIKAIGLTKIFRTESVQTTALNEISIEISEGEFVAIMGPSGCGKSTLLNMLGLLDNPTSGQLWFIDKEVSRYSENDRTDMRNGNIGFVFQSFNLIDELTVFVTNPRIILADEPTGNLDSTNGNEVMALLKELNKDGATIVMVTHSEENAREANRIVRMMDGCILTESKR